MSILFMLNMTLTAVLMFLTYGGGDPLCQLPFKHKYKTGNLVQTNSESELEHKIKSSLNASYGQITEPYYYLASSDDANKPHSFTNTQKSHIDEADRLKTNGDYLYVSTVNDSSINVLKANKDSAPLIGSLKFKTINDTALSGIYLVDNTQKLVALANDKQDNLALGNNWFNPNFWQARKTEVFSVDINDPTAPKQINKLTFDGQLISSRKIGYTLYLTTRHTPYLEGLHDSPANQAEINHNKALIANASLAHLLPQMKLNEQAIQPLFETDDCFVTAANTSNNQHASIISVLAVNLQNLQEKPMGQCFVGDTETVYASHSAIYLATAHYQHNDTQDGIRYDTTVNTNIHKFSLLDTVPRYAGSGTVEGHLGWQQDLKSFRMSEHKGVLRVITYIGEDSNTQDSPARLHTLIENKHSNTLEILAQLPNTQRPEPLGKKGEQIFASRFIGNRGYLVTFRLTDPLYILDLSNPKDPFIASELEVDGYADYLHPVGENYLFGIGKNAVLDARDETGDGRGVWYQGIKLSLIDISDPTAPFEKQVFNIGKRGTETAVSRTHHALTSLRKGNMLHIALPVSLHETINEQYKEHSNQPWFSYQWTRDELHRLKINMVSGEITKLATLTIPKTDTDSYSNWSWPYDRSAIIDDSVYYLNEDQVMVQ